jgi:uncharacterized protein YjbJ (UPF0337 family)
MRITVDVPDNIVKNVDQKAKTNYRSRKQQVESDLQEMYGKPVQGRPEKIVGEIKNKMGINEHSIDGAMKKLGISNK